jgi:hypothetical protein
METIFVGKNGKIYSIGDLEINKILTNEELLASHTM